MRVPWWLCTAARSEVRISRGNKTPPCPHQLRSRWPGPPLGGPGLSHGAGNGDGRLPDPQLAVPAARLPAPWRRSRGRRGFLTRNPHPLPGLAGLTQPQRSTWGRRPKSLSPHALHVQINVPFVSVARGSECQHCISKLDK